MAGAPLTAAEIEQLNQMLGTRMQANQGPIVLGPPPPPPTSLPLVAGPPPPPLVLPPAGPPRPPPVPPPAGPPRMIAQLPVQRAPEATPMSDLRPTGPARGPAMALGLDLPPGIGGGRPPIVALKQAPTVDTSGVTDPNAPAAGASSDEAPPTGGPSPSPLTVVPGGWQPHSRSGRFDVPEGTQAQFMGADALHAAAIEQQTDAATARSDAEAAQLLAAERGVRGMDTGIASREAERAAALRAQQVKLEELTERVNHGPEISADRFWAKRSTGAKIFAILGVALGGFAAGMKGGENQALTMLEHAMDRDLEAQKAQAANARGKLADQRGLLGTMKENFADERQAEAGAKVAYLARTEMQLKALAAQSQSPEVQARATDMLASLQERRAARQLEFDRLAQGNLTEAYRQPQIVGGAGAASSAKNLELFVPTGPDGEGFYAKTVDEAKKGRAMHTAVSALENAVNTGIAIRKKTNPVERGISNVGIYDTSDMASLQSSGAQAQAAAKDAEQVGAWDNGSEKLTGKLTGQLAATTGNPEAAALSYLASKKKQFAEFERSQGGIGANQAFSRDAQGRLVPVTVTHPTMAAPRGQMPSGFKPIGGSAPEYVPSPQQPYEGDITDLPAAIARRKKQRGDGK